MHGQNFKILIQILDPRHENDNALNTLQVSHARSSQNMKHGTRRYPEYLLRSMNCIKYQFFSEKKKLNYFS